MTLADLAAGQQQTAGQQQPGVVPQPVPTSIRVVQVAGPQGNLVVLELSTPVGVAVYFLEPKSAKELGQRLVQYGVASNLLIAGADTIPPAGPPA